MPDSSIKQNELKSDLLLSSITGLDNFCLNQTVKVLVSEKNGTEIVLRVLKSQDWNQVSDILSYKLKIAFI